MRTSFFSLVLAFMAHAGVANAQIDSTPQANTVDTITAFYPRDSLKFDGLRSSVYFTGDNLERYQIEPYVAQYTQTENTAGDLDLVFEFDRVEMYTLYDYEGRKIGILPVDMKGVSADQPFEEYIVERFKDALFIFEDGPRSDTQDNSFDEYRR